ncbi:MAG: HRDC domain-containing protein [Bacteroidetes bacterium]|nr:HRDC domain-containing protein [Bacteroidota bacterium]
MQLKLFTIPVTDTGAFTEELNRFLRANKILEVENHLISNEHGASWCFCVKYIESGWTPHPGDRPKTDYKTELDAETFEVFSKLREARKQLALEDAVPAYAICTDQEMALIAKLKELTLENLLTVKGFGDKKLEKYGNRLILIVKQKTQDEKGREPV